MSPRVSALTEPGLTLDRVPMLQFPAQSRPRADSWQIGVGVGGAW